MSNDVQQYVARASGLGGMMPVNDQYQGADKRYVLAEDYNWLKVELEHAKSLEQQGLEFRQELIRKLDEALAELQALKAPCSEAPEPVAWRMWNGKTWRFCYSDLHGKRGWEPLMTVAQHERILAAQQSTPERVSVPVELLERTVGNGLGSSIKAIGELRILLEGWKV